MRTTMSWLSIGWRVSLPVCMLLMLSSARSFAVTKHTVTLDDLLTLREATYLQISPDGEILAYTTQDGSLWLANTKPGSQPRRVGLGKVPHWSPDGRHLAFYSTSSGALQLWKLELASGHKIQLTHFAAGIRSDPALSLWWYDSLCYSWSPDSTRLVFASEVTAGQKRTSSSFPGIFRSDPDLPLVLNNDTPPQWTLKGVFNNQTPLAQRAASKPEPAFSELFVVDVRSRRVEQITHDGAGDFHPNWSPDGRSIVYVSTEGQSVSQDGTAPSNVYTLDLVTRTRIALTNTSVTKRLPVWSPDGHWIAFFGRLGFGTQSVFVIQSHGGAPVSLTAKLDRNVMEYDWSGDSRSIIVICADGVSWRIIQMGLNDREPKDLSKDANGSRSLLTISRMGTLAWEESNASRTGLLKIRPPQSPTEYVLLNLNPQIESWKLGRQKIIRWKNPTNEAMEGILILPAKYSAGKTYPVIVDAYPHISDSFKGDPMLGNQAWASRGFAVFFPNARAPHVYNNFFKSETFDQAAKGAKGWDVTVADVASGMDELIRLGIIDPTKIGLYGFSNGGGIVNYLVSKTDRFKCAVSVAGALADWIRPVFLHTDSPVPRWAGGATPWSNPETYIQLSAVFHLEQVNTPMLLADGDNDGEFLLDNIEMYNGLRWFRRSVTLLRYPRQGHGFSGKALIDFWKRENVFFDDCLSPPGDQNP